MIGITLIICATVIAVKREMGEDCAILYLLGASIGLVESFMLYAFLN